MFAIWIFSGNIEKSSAVTNMDFSKSAFFKFLDYLSDSKLMKPETIRGWRVAALKLLSTLTEAEEADVRNIDFDIAVLKVVNQSSGSIKPGSLSTYRNRVSIAIKEFVKWKNDPAGYKPRGLTGKSAKPNESADRHKASNRSNSPEQEVSTKADSEDIVQSSISLIYPLRPDFLAKTVVPRDLTLEEAKRLSAFLSTIAIDFKPE